LGLFDKLRQGTEVYGPDNKSIGKIDRWDDNHIYIGGRSYPRSSFDRFDNDRLYFSNEGYRSYQSGLGTAGAAGMAGRTGMQAEGEIRVPVMEERLAVGKREVELGEVEIRKEVTAEQVNVPVELTREEVHVERVDVADRPIAAGDMPDAFKEGTIRVPVRGEEVVAQKQAVVTGEVVIDRERTTETQTISDTVRKERVEVDENYQRARGDFQRHFEGRRAGLTGTAADTRRFEDAEPNYRTGFYAAHDDRYAGRNFEDVEPDLRREHASGSGDSWEHLRQEIREGWDRARR
jgi:uncharacterized protein (TIGR02271 family)